MAKVAQVLGLSRAAVATWKQVPSNHLSAIVAATGIPAAKLRPDLAEVFKASGDVGNASAPVAA